MEVDILKGIKIEAPVKRYSPRGRQGIQIGYNNGGPSQEKMDYTYEDVPVIRSDDKLITKAYCPFKGTMSLKEGFYPEGIKHQAMHLYLSAKGSTVEYKKEGRPWDCIFHIDPERRLIWDFEEDWKNDLTLDAGHTPALLQFHFICPLIVRSEWDHRLFSYMLCIDSRKNETLIPSIHLWL